MCKFPALHVSNAPFCVSVPVLSLSKYSMRPSSSGRVLVRTIVSGISLSCMIWCAYTVFPISKFTRKLYTRIGMSSTAMGSTTYLMGIIDEKRIKKRKT